MSHCKAVLEMEDLSALYFATVEEVGKLVSEGTLRLRLAAAYVFLCLCVCACVCVCVFSAFSLRCCDISPPLSDLCCLLYALCPLLREFSGPLSSCRASKLSTSM